jgi:hypothetical protein
LARFGPARVSRKEKIMFTLVAILHLLAFFCFVFAAIPVPSRINLQAAGLAFWMLSLLVARG